MNYFDPQTIFLGVVFLAVVLAAEGLFIYFRDVRGPAGRVSRRMQMLAAGASNDEILATLRRAAPEASSFAPKFIASLDTKLTQAGLKIPAKRFAAYMAAATLVIGIGFPLVGGIAGKVTSLTAVLLILVFAAVIGVMLPMMWLTGKAAKRIKTFEAQFPIALDIFVRGLRAGHPVTSALELLVTEVADPIASEFGIVVSEMNYGYDLRGALANLAKRVQTQDVQMFVVSVAIQAETGGSLADILDGLSKVIRDRASMVLKVRALASEGKMTGMLLSVLPAGTFCFTFASQPNFYLDVIDDRWFMPGCIGIALLYTSGIMIMRKMIDLKV